MKGPVEEGLSVVVAQPLDVETAQRLRWQAEHERERGSATCRAVVAVVRMTSIFFTGGRGGDGFEDHGPEVVRGLI